MEDLLIIIEAEDVLSEEMNNIRGGQNSGPIICSTGIVNPSQFALEVM